MKPSTLALLALLALGSAACGSSDATHAYGEKERENPFGTREEKLQIAVTVTYRERMALPPNSTVRAALYDESQDLKPAISSNAVSTREGRGVPVELEITYPLDQLDHSHEYVIRGEITDPSGKLLFTTDEPVHVITNQDEPQKIELVLKRAG